MSNAAASYVSRYDRIDDDGDDDQPFWLYDPEGDPVIIPSACVGFQVRYWSPNQRGLGTVVVDVRNGRPLILPRSTSPDEFAERVGYKVGRYRLFLLDGAHRRMECNPGQIEVTPEMAAARGGVEVGPGASTTPAPSGDATLVAQVLAFAERMSAQAFAQSSSAQHELAESQRHLTTQVATMVGTTSGVLTAAGSSGVVKKTLALDAAAAGAPVTVQMVPSNQNEAPPRNAAGAAATATATAAAAAAEKGTSMGDALVTLGLPVVEKFGAMLAYGAAKKLDVPEDYARSVAGLVQSTAQVAAKMMQPEPEAPPTGATPAATVPPAATVGVAARAGRELMAHVLEIQRALSEDDRAWVMQQMGSRRGLIDALKPSVASLTVEEGAAAVRNLRAMDAALSTDHERRLFDTIMDPEQLPALFRRLFVDSPAEQSIANVRQHAAQIAGIAAAKEAADANG